MDKQQDSGHIVDWAQSIVPGFDGRDGGGGGFPMNQGFFRAFRNDAPNKFTLLVDLSQQLNQQDSF